VPRLRTIIIDESGRRPRINRPRLSSVLDAALADAGIGEARLTVLLVDQAASAALHLQHFADGEATDVMTFPDGSASGRRGAIHLGDLAVCVDVALREADARAVPLADELTLYIVHGLLHLLGYDDRTRAAQSRMWAAQRRLLAGVGIAIGRTPG
jgi:probable rRNA maturation factor